MRSKVTDNGLQSTTASSPFTSDAQSDQFASTCPPDRVFKINDLMGFRRGRGDLAFSIFMVFLALFFLAAFWTQTGWDKRDLPDELGTYLLRQFGIVEVEGRLARFGRILRQS